MWSAPGINADGSKAGGYAVFHGIEDLSTVSLETMHLDVRIKGCSRVALTESSPCMSSCSLRQERPTSQRHDIFANDAVVYGSPFQLRHTDQGK